MSFYITDSDGSGHYTDFTFSAPSNGLVNKHVFNIISTHNGSPLSADDVEIITPEIENQHIGIILTTDSQSPFRFMANISEAGTSVRTAADTVRQKPSFRIEEGGIIPIIGMFLGPPRQFNPKHNTSTFIDR